MADRCDRQTQNQAFRGYATNTLPMHDTSVPRFARMLRKLDAIPADADKAGFVVGQRQQPAPATAPRGGVRQIGSGLQPACLS